MRQLRSVPSSKDDLRRLVAWYLIEGPTRPDVVVAEIDHLTNRPLINLKQYAKVDRCPATRDVRFTATKKRKMVIIYETTATEVILLSFSHQSAKRRPWRKRLDEV